MYFSYQLTFDNLVSPLDKCILIVLTSFDVLLTCIKVLSMGHVWVTPLSIIFQLNRGHWCRKPQYPEETTGLHATKY